MTRPKPYRLILLITVMSALNVILLVEAYDNIVRAQYKTSGDLVDHLLQL